MELCPTAHPQFLATTSAYVCRLHAVAGRLAALVSDESALEACICDDVLYKLTIITFYLYINLTLGLNLL